MFFGFILLFVNVQGIFLQISVPKLIVMSYSGFRYDYFTRNVTPFMNQLREEWASADYMKNVFVTKTNPNHFSIATGYYAETHGVIDNRVFHPEGAAITNSLELYTYGAEILPIWIINELSGKHRHSGSMMWPGGEYQFNGSQATHVMKFDNKLDWKSRIDRLINWFIHPVHPINLAMLYFEEPDLHTQVFGTKDPVINDLLRQLDNITMYLYDQLEKYHLTDVNVIHISDHGMVDASVANIINITAIIGDENYDVLGSPSTKFIKPKRGNGKEIYTKLKVSAEITRGFDVYWKDDIPERFHLRENRRVTEIFIIAKRGFIFEEIVERFESWESTFDIKISNESVIAAAGYDNEYSEMRPFFFATGPAFEKNCTLESFNNIDLFSLFCKVLEIDCHKTNGTVESFGECLSELKHESSMNLLLVVIISIILFLAIIALIIIFSARRLRQDRFIIDSDRKSQEDIVHGQTYQKKVIG